MELSDLLQDHLLWFCKSSNDSNNSFDPPQKHLILPQLPSRLTPKSRFGAPKTTTDVQEAKGQEVPKKTKQNTCYCVHQWRTYRRETPALSDIIPSNLQHRLNYFVLEVCKKASIYQIDFLHHFCSRIMPFMIEKLSAC